MIAPFISATQAQNLGIDKLLFADCRWYLDERDGRTAYNRGHLPGAIFVDVDMDLAAPASRQDGRHPLPTPEDFAATLSRLGIDPETTVIAYDDDGGVIAARLVWMLRAIGVAAAVLDGGIKLWPGKLSQEIAQKKPSVFLPVPWPSELLADISEVTDPAKLVLDARPAERFRGEVTGADLRPGHIPGAVSVACRKNLDDDGRLLPHAILREKFTRAGVNKEKVNHGLVISSCGSGVTACHNLLAIEALGLGRARLYPGSWSQYAATDLPAQTGD